MRSSNGLFWIAGIALLVGGMAVSIGAPADARIAKRLEDVGISTTATIQDVRETRGTRRTSATVVTVEFADDFGLSAEAEANYCGEVEDVAPGDEIGIVYDPDDTSIVQFQECTYPTDASVLLIIGIAAVVIGTILVLRAWASSGWKRRRWGIPIAILGVLFAGTSFEDECACAELIYIGAAMVIIGLVPQLIPRKPASSETALPR